MEKRDGPLGLELESKTIQNSFTPVRRKESTLNDGRLNRNVEKEWTAARCNRLLRPLTSRISILHKSKQSSLDRIKIQSKKGKSVSESSIDAQGEEMTNNNANWVARKRVKRTYSGKTCIKGSRRYISNTEPSVIASLNGRGSSVPGEIVVPTPLLNRAYNGITLGHCHRRNPNSISDEPTKARLLGTRKAQTLESQALCKIRNTMSPTRFNIYEGIYNGLEALLRATIPTSPKKGPKSLLSMCLATIPKVITMEEKLSPSEMKRDISTEIYDDLELLGSSGRGWTHLQNVVRAHGVQIICDAILEGLLECNFCEILVDLCMISDNHNEAELILSSLLSVCRFPAPAKIESHFLDDVAHRPLLKIRKFVENTGRTGYEYRQLSALIQNGILPFQWVATPVFTPIWTGLMQELSLDHARADATTFMDTVLPCLVEYVSLSESWLDTDLYKRCRSILLSVLTTISSIILLSRDVTGNTMEQESKRTTTISDTHLKLLKDCVTVIKRHSRENDLQSTILHLACLVTEPNVDDMSNFIMNPLYRMYAEGNGDSGIEITSSLVQKPLSAYNEAVRFISSVARCCGKGAFTSGFEYLQYIHRRLKQVNTGRGLKARTIWHGIIVDSAFAFAQEAPGQKYLDYADSLDGELHADSSRRPGSARKESCHESRAFRWEEGISSWVTATPATNISKTKSITTNFESDEVEFESPSIARVQRPALIGRESKRKYGEYDQPTELEIQLPSRLEKKTRPGKSASFDIWHCDSSDDELNSSYESSQNTRVLKEVRNAAARRRSKLVETKRQKESPTINYEQSSFSEDELCI
ncbi:hypothetical protein NHQ30_005673 [Ciborinia camelliae]|nr:hypothetical protein NHQ30_005673 [Ciborinia camelliae]